MDVWGFQSPKEIPIGLLRNGLIPHHLLLRYFAIMTQVAPVRNLLSCTLYHMPSAMLVAVFYIHLGDEGRYHQKKGFSLDICAWL